MKFKWRYLWLLLLGLALIWTFIHKRAVHYAYLQLKGQLNIITNTQPVNQVLLQKETTKEAKDRIKLIQDIKQYAIDSLGLSASDSYTSYFEQNGKPILWVITASKPYELEAKEWSFPIVGTFKYKGFFDYAFVEKELELLHNEGYETRVSEVSAWSTLGILNDPILSSMLERDEAALAELIIHELTHGTLFVKNDLSFNENLASFIGAKGAEKYLSSKYGPNSSVIENWRNKERNNQKIRSTLFKGAQRLDSLYQTFDKNLTSHNKEKQKKELIKEIVQEAYGVELGEGDLEKYNNAFFVGFLTYREKQNTFEEMYEKQFNNDFSSFLNHMKSEHTPLFSWF